MPCTTCSSDEEVGRTRGSMRSTRCPVGCTRSFRLTPEGCSRSQSVLGGRVQLCGANRGVSPTSEIAITVTGQRQSGAGPSRDGCGMAGHSVSGPPQCGISAKMVRSGQGPGGTRGKMTEALALLSARRSFFLALTSELMPREPIAPPVSSPRIIPCPPFAAYLSILA